MDNQQYINLMYHLSYLESMLEVVADKVDSPETGGGYAMPDLRRNFSYVYAGFC